MESDIEALRTYAEDQGLTFPILSDKGGSVSMNYRVTGIPASYFITREGNVHVKRIGPMDMEIIAGYVARLW